MDEERVDPARFEGLHLDLGLLGVEQRDELAMLDSVTRLDIPFEDRALLHLRA